MAYKEATILASAARTVTGEGTAVDTMGTGGAAVSYGGFLAPDANSVGGPGAADTARFYLNVSAASGTGPTLDVTLVVTINTVEYTVGTFAQKVAAGKETITVVGCPRNVKAKYTIAGTGPSFTFEVQVTR